MPGRKHHHHQDERFGFDVYSSRISAKMKPVTFLFTENWYLPLKKSRWDVVGVMGTIRYLRQRNCVDPFNLPGRNFGPVHALFIARSRVMA